MLVDLVRKLWLFVYLFYQDLIFYGVTEMAIVPSKKMIAICQYGGDFDTYDDGTMNYVGGEAYAVDLDENMQLSGFKQEIAETIDLSVDAMIIKYFLPGNKKNLITVSKDKDFQRMVSYYKDADQLEVFIMKDSPAGKNAKKKQPARRPQKATPNVETAAIVQVAPVSNAVALNDQHVDIETTTEITPAAVPISSNPFPMVAVDDDSQRLAAKQWENIITGVGQRFHSLAEFREALRKYSIAHAFNFVYKKNENQRVTVKCKAEGCPWRIHASKLSTTQLVCIKTMRPVHNCQGVTSKAPFRAKRSWVGNLIKEKVKESPKIKPKEIATELKRDYGIDLNYSQARRAKEYAREQLLGSYKDAYSELPFFCEKIMETNPGSLANYSTKEDSSFHRLFVCFHASVSGFLHGCRPLLFLDSTPLNSRYQGMLLTATAADGDDGAFPVAFAVVDEENDDNWHWFLTQLKPMVSPVGTPGQITFVADFQKGIRESLREIFGGECYHAFEKCCEDIKAISPEAYNWVIRSEPEHWANAFFGGLRYNHMTSNFGHMFYSWVSEANELPITQMIDELRGKMMQLIYTRRVESTQWMTRLTPSMEEKLKNEIIKGRSVQVIRAHGSKFEVRYVDMIEVVDIENWDCSCKGWLLTGLPCCHAIAVLEQYGRSPYDHCSRYFHVEMYHLTYADSIHPIPNVERLMDTETEDGAVLVTPPPTMRTPGRTKIRKVAPGRIGPSDFLKRQLQCGKCKGLGHNKRSCKSMISD
ncbi:putative transcription factor interactor and regulator CCHC(Zn) family [Helianthus annuus]|nr:putative transcription factor interactor and regulator CCHC(Zn) family [Helianthus annuus]